MDKVVLIVSIGEFSLKTSNDIIYDIENLCEEYNVKYSDLDDKNILWGYKVSVTLEGNKNDINVVTNILKIDYKVKAI